MNDRTNLRVMVVIGTRPEAIKLWPVIRVFRMHPEVQLHVCLTAQHRDLLDMFVRELDVRPDSDLNLMQADQSLAELSSRLIPAITELFSRERPDMVLVQGDTTSAALSALAAFYMHIYVGHVEAGLRSGNRYSPFPEEVNRRMVTSLADIHFAPTEHARLNLVSEGVGADDVFVTGNTVIDAVRAMAGEREQSQSPRILITAHRRENFGEPLRQIFRGIRMVAARRPQLEIVYPVHPNPNVYGVAQEMLGGAENIRLCAPMGYREFVSEMQKAWFVVSDSGGVQEEATALGKPMLLLRKETERPEGIEAGNIRRVRLEAAAVAGEIELLLDDAGLRRSMTKVSDVYGDGHAAERIVDHCLTFLQQHTVQGGSCHCKLEQGQATMSDLMTKFHNAAWMPADGIARSYVHYRSENASEGVYKHLGGRAASPRLSVIIPTADADRGGYFQNLLRQIGVQSYGDYELIVVKGDSRQGRSINVGADLAKGEYILTLDDDSSLPDQETFSKLIDALDFNPDIGMAGGNNTVPDWASPFVKRVMRQVPRRSWDPVTQITDSDLAEHPCLIMRTADFKVVGGENELIPRGLDPYLRREFRKLGKRVVLIPGVIYHHLPPGSWNKLLRQFYRNGQQAAFVNRYYPQWMIETPAEHGAFEARRPFIIRVFRFPGRLLKALVTGKFIFFLSEVAYAAGFIYEVFFNTHRYSNISARDSRFHPGVK